MISYDLCRSQVAATGNTAADGIMGSTEAEGLD